MEAHRLRAPSTDGALLAVPPLPESHRLLAANLDHLSKWDYDFQGRRASRLRPLVRSEVLERAGRFLADAGLAPPELTAAGEAPHLIVTGHQPELFHPGVWMKNFATARIAQQTGALGLNFIVDNDTPKSNWIKVPASGRQGLGIERIAFDEWQGEIPYEDLAVADEALFATFGDRVRQVLRSTIARPVLDELWPQAVGFRSATRKLGDRLALARHAVEASWGPRNVEVPLSSICETEGFLWFVAHILADLPRFQEIHNDSLIRYRKLYHIRSRHHPVPALARYGDWREAPFWIWRAELPRRRPLLVRQLARSMELRVGGENDSLLEIPLAPDREACCAVDQLRGLPGLGIRLRTRALTTTMFARYLLGDLFLHGIGGAKYDELGDAISSRFFGFEPPAYMTISMSLWPGLEHDPTASGRLAADERTLRDLTWNPDRHLHPTTDTDPDAARWIEAKRQAIDRPAHTPAEKLERFAAIRRSNEALQACVESQRTALHRVREQDQSAARVASLARSREYAAVLHPRERLRKALESALPGLHLSGE
jgi:hypothetical protein